MNNDFWKVSFIKNNEEQCVYIQATSYSEEDIIKIFEEIYFGIKVISVDKALPEKAKGLE